MLTFRKNGNKPKVPAVTFSAADTNSASNDTAAVAQISMISDRASDQVASPGASCIVESSGAKISR